MSFCPSDSPVGPKHGDAGGQDPQWPQQVDHSPELGAPSYVSDTKLRGINWIKSAPSPAQHRDIFWREQEKHPDVGDSLLGLPWPHAPLLRGGLLIMHLSTALLCSQKTVKNCPQPLSEECDTLWTDRHCRVRPGVSFPPSTGTPSAVMWPAAPKMAVCESGTQPQAAVNASSPDTRSRSPASAGEGMDSYTLLPKTAPSKSGGPMM